jgi:hypothetical protein
MTLASKLFSLERWWEGLVERTPVKYISLVLGGFGAALPWKYPPVIFGILSGRLQLLLHSSYCSLIRF